MPSTTTDNPQDSRRDVSVPVIVGLLVSLFGATLLGWIDLPHWVDATATRSFLANSLSSWLLVGLVFLIVLYGERRPLRSIGLQTPTRRETVVGFGAGLLAVVLGLFVTGVAVVALQLEQPETLSALSQLSIPVQLVIVGTAVVAEEVLWRGYPIERVSEVTGSIWIGAAVSGTVFLAVHFPAWGLVGAIPQAVFTLVLVSVYVWSRNLVACMLTHGVINVLMIMVLPAVL